MNLNLLPRTVQLESGWVAQVVLVRHDPLMRDMAQAVPEVVWESDEAFQEESTARDVADEALVDAARQLFKGVQR